MVLIYDICVVAGGGGRPQADDGVGPGLEKEGEGADEGKGGRGGGGGHCGGRAASAGGLAIETDGCHTRRIVVGIVARNDLSPSEADANVCSGCRDLFNSLLAIGEFVFSRHSLFASSFFKGIGV